MSSKEGHADSLTTYENLAGYTVQIRSVAGESTSIVFPGQGLNFVFDLGRVYKAAVGQPLVFITHGHLDHIGSLQMHATTRALSGMPAPTYVVPHVCVNPVNAIFSAFSELDGGSIQYKLQGIDSDSIIAFPKGRSNNEAKITMHTDRTTVPPGLFATPWDTEHAVVSHGYIIWRQMKKLKADYKELTRQEISDLCRTGEDVTELHASPEIAFSGDSTIQGITRCDDACRTRLLIMECTFLDDEVFRVKAEERGHLGLLHFAEAWSSGVFKNEHILLTHFSARFSGSQIINAVTTRLILSAVLEFGLRDKLSQDIPNTPVSQEFVQSILTELDTGTRCRLKDFVTNERPLVTVTAGAHEYSMSDREKSHHIDFLPFFPTVEA